MIPEVWRITLFYTIMLIEFYRILYDSYNHDKLRYARRLEICQIVSYNPVVERLIRTAYDKEPFSEQKLKE